MNAGPREGRSSLLREWSGGLGDLGTFLPHVAAAITVAGLAPAGVLFGFGAFLIGSGLFYGLPMAVQPMKAVSAVLLTDGLSPAEVAAAGVILGAILLALGLFGAIGRIARLIPQSVTAGLQLGLGGAMAWLGIELISGSAWVGIAALAALVALMRWTRLPAVPLVLVLATAAALASGETVWPGDIVFAFTLPAPILPGADDLVHAFASAAVPQLPLTLTNAVIVTAALSRDLFPDRAARASERNLSLTTGLANLVLAPLGALPMCHGAGGLQAQHRFGARTGAAPVSFGIGLVVLALGFSGSAAALIAAVPLAAVGALLVVAGADLALSRRVLDARPSCWPVIVLAAALTMMADPAVGLIAGWVGEAVRRQVVRAIYGRTDRRSQT